VNVFNLVSFLRLLMIVAFLGQSVGAYASLSYSHVALEESSFTIEDSEADESLHAVANVNSSIHPQNFLLDGPCKCIFGSFLFEGIILHETGPPART